MIKGHSLSMTGKGGIGLELGGITHIDDNREL